MPDNCDGIKNKTRWIRTSVDFFDHGVLDAGPYDRRSAWLWLIAHAAWKDKSVNHKGSAVKLKRGQVLAGRKFLAQKWGWSEQNVRTFLKHLKNDEMIESNQSNGHYANIITICNYEEYQTSKPKDNQPANQSLTSVQPEPNQTLTKNTNIPNKTPSKTRARNGKEFWSDAFRTDQKKIWVDESTQQIIISDEFRNSMAGTIDDDLIDSARLTASGSLNGDRSEEALLRLFNRQLGYAQRDLQQGLKISQAKAERQKQNQKKSNNGSRMAAYLASCEGVSA